MGHFAVALLTLVIQESPKHDIQRYAAVPASPVFAGLPLPVVAYAL